MKKMILIITVILTFQNTIAQTNTVNRNGGFISFDSPSGTYIKDIDNTFDKFLGNWKWQEGSKILLFKIEKVTKHYYSEFNTYEDFIKGSYSYSENDGASFIVNNIATNLSNNDSETLPMFATGVNNQKTLVMLFRDALIVKERCNAKFTFLDNSVNQMHVLISNGGGGYAYPTPLPDPNFSIPTNVILTKM